MSQPQQLVFDLPHLEAFEAEDFLVSQCNQSAVDMIDSWPDWPAHAIVICGAAGSGKSHLVSVWRERSGGDVVGMGDVTTTTVSRFQETGRLAVEDVAPGGDPNAERRGCELLSAARASKSSNHISLIFSPPSRATPRRGIVVLAVASTFSSRT